MASREKKLAAPKKQQTASPSPVPPETAKNESSAEETKVTAKNTTAKATASKTNATIAKKLTKKNVPAKPATKKPTIAIKLKTKPRKKPVKVKEKVTKDINKKKEVKNGVNPPKPRKKAQKVNKDKAEKDDKPPLLEPILPVDENTVKKVAKKRVTKKATQVDLDKKVKLDIDDNLSVASDVTDTSITDTSKPRKRMTKKMKIEPEADVKQEIETFEEVMHHLESLISNEEIKKEPENSIEPLKSEVIKPKRLPKRKAESLKNKILKEENIENRFEKLDPVQLQTVDGLNLDVTDLKKCVPIKQRRHSIEKISLDSISADMKPASVFGNLPQSLSPRTKRASKIRQSIDTTARKSSPYMRSDSPARTLRNGKRMKDANLLGGINAASKKRKVSDFGGSDLTVSKLSGYDSDSSFSDLASLHGDTKDIEANISLDITLNKENTAIPSLSNKIKVTSTPTETFKKLSSNVIDTNSNVYEQLDQTIDNKNKKDINIFRSEPSFNSIGVTPKVPDKFLILDIMKQTFNDVPDENKIKHDTKSENASSLAAKADDDAKKNENKTVDDKHSENIDNNGLTDSVTTEIPLISPITPTAKEMEKSDDLKLDEIILKLEEAMDTEEITTPPQSNDVTLISNDIISTPIYPDALKSSLSLALRFSDSMSTSQTVEKPQIAETEKTEEETQVSSVMVPKANEPEESVQPIKSSDTDNIVSVETGAIPVSKEETEKLNDSAVPGPSCDSVIPGPSGDSAVPSPSCDSAVLGPSYDSVILGPICDSAVPGPSCDIAVPDPNCDNAVPSPSCDNATPGPSCEIKNYEPMEVVLPNNDDISEPSDNAGMVQVMEKDDGSKEVILRALGLHTLKEAEEAKLKLEQKAQEKGISKCDSYTSTAKYTGSFKSTGTIKSTGTVKSTGPLKAVITLNRDKKKTKLKTSSQKKANYTETESGSPEDMKAINEGAGTSGKHGGQSSDTAGAHRKTHYYNRSNMDGSSEHTSDGEVGSQEGASKALVIPEKASSFSIHPERLCKDDCSHCLNKFGMFDTPCHIAQIKNIEKQNNILSYEKHLTHDSCLCEACFRLVDRKANAPSYISKSDRRRRLIAPGPKKNHCHVLGCIHEADNEIRRKWIIRMKKSVCQVINIDLDNPGLHSIPICKDHYAALEHLMVCALCTRKLAKNHIHYLGSELTLINEQLTAEGIPITMLAKSVICRLCKQFCGALLKTPEERVEGGEEFFDEYKTRILHFNSGLPIDEALVDAPLSAPAKDKSFDKVKEPPKKKRKVMKNQNDNEPPHLEPEVDLGKEDQTRVPSSDSNSQKSQSRSESPNEYMVDYNTLVPAINMECGSDGETSNKPEQHKKQTIIVRKKPRPEAMRKAVAIPRKYRNDKNSDNIAVQRLGSNPSISVRQVLPGEEDLKITANIEFGNVIEKTPEGWEKCNSVIQYDLETKELWQELQKPYGNQSSFIKHLTSLEKFFRNGDLVLSSHASPYSSNYIESLRTRQKAYDNLPSNAGPVQPLSMLPFNKSQKSNSGIITSISKNKELAICSTQSNGAPSLKDAPLTITQLPSAPASTSTMVKPKPSSTVPGLIQLHPGTARPVAPLIRVPVSQTRKLKFPITKDWSPNLVPIDPKTLETNPEFLHLVKDEKHYRVSVAEYKKMLLAKQQFDAMQKNKSAQKWATLNPNSILKRIVPGKGLIISKAKNVSRKPQNISLPSFDSTECENSLEKLDKQVEKLEASLNDNKQPVGLPKIPKSLTVIPQTVSRKPVSRPTSPGIQITPKPKPPNMS